MFVVPPRQGKRPEPASYIRLLSILLNSSYFSPNGPSFLSPSVSSWFRTSTVLPPGPGKAHIPSALPGTHSPSSIFWPMCDTTVYLNPGGRSNKCFPSGLKTVGGSRGLVVGCVLGVVAGALDVSAASAEAAHPGNARSAANPTVTALEF